MNLDVVLENLRSYKTTIDDDNIRLKEKIKKELLDCDELIYALHNTEFEETGVDNDEYFGTNILPYLSFPDSQTSVKNYLCFKMDFDEISTSNKIMKYNQVIFVILCHNSDIMDRATGIARHDLISAILIEQFNWSNIFGTQCKLISNKESVTDSDYVTRTLIFEFTTPNSIARTSNRTTSIINNKVKI